LLSFADKNPDERELAEVMFKRIGGAYGLLSSSSGRSYYDRCIESKLTPGSAAELAVEWTRMVEVLLASLVSQGFSLTYHHPLLRWKSVQRRRIFDRTLK